MDSIYKHKYTANTAGNRRITTTKRILAKEKTTKKTEKRKGR